MGSFTNLFRSKERFALAVLDHYVARLERLMHATLEDQSLASAQRIAAYFDAIEQRFSDRDWEVGCLIPDLATEVPAHSETLRTAVAFVLEKQTTAFAAVLRQLVGLDQPDDLAAVLLAAWQGTLLRMKVERSALPIARFRRVLARLMST